MFVRTNQGYSVDEYKFVANPAVFFFYSGTTLSRFIADIGARVSQDIAAICLCEK